MAYSTITDLQKYIEASELIELCTEDSTKTITDTEVTTPVAEVIESADAIIDSYLLGRWEGLRSIATPPPMVNFTSCVLAVNLLYLRRRKMPPAWKPLYDERMAWLIAVSKGELILPEDSLGTKVADTAAKFQSDAREITDDDNLNDLDPRNFTATKISLLTGVPYRDES